MRFLIWLLLRDNPQLKTRSRVIRSAHADGRRKVEVGKEVVVWRVLDLRQNPKSIELSLR